MSSLDFKFKQFSLRHDRSTMKVGTDGVLLGAWAGTGDAKKILDIGTGSGLIALMLAQRTMPGVSIDALEIEQHAFEQAQENTVRSPWRDKVKVFHIAIQDFNTTEKYDLIVSNPPYFQNSQRPPDEKRLQARHTTSLTYPELLSSVRRLINAKGKFNVILPHTEGLQFIDFARPYNLHCTRQWSFRTRKEKPIERWLLEFSVHEAFKEDGEIILYSTHDEWSEGYKKLTKDFYIKL
jgi:tRNA1Val (adenine37-N6)-methyltransferase